MISKVNQQNSQINYLLYMYNSIVNVNLVIQKIIPYVNYHEH